MTSLWYCIFYPCNRLVAGKRMKTEREVKVELFLKMSTSRTKNGLIMTTGMSSQSWKVETLMTVVYFRSDESTMISEIEVSFVTVK